jgi:hypothetical protein
MVAVMGAGTAPPLRSGKMVAVRIRIACIIEKNSNQGAMRSGT